MAGRELSALLCWWSTTRTQLRKTNEPDGNSKHNSLRGRKSECRRTKRICWLAQRDGARHQHQRHPSFHPTLNCRNQEKFISLSNPLKYFIYSKCIQRLSATGWNVCVLALKMNCYFQLCQEARTERLRLALEWNNLLSTVRQIRRALR
jgi:hypothetical protein